MSETYQASFAGGEVSPEIAARADLAKYSIFSDKCRNMIVQQQGGVTRRPGTVFVDECGDTSVKRLIPFIIAFDECYVLEFGAGYMRAYDKTGRVTATDLITPLSEENIKALNYCQVKDSLLLVDGEHIKEVTRSLTDGVVSFVISEYNPKYGPFTNESDEEAPVGTISKNEDNLYLETLSDVFLNSNVGKQYRLKMFINGDTIIFNGNDMGQLKDKMLVCYSSYSLRVRTGWTGKLNMEVSKDGVKWDVKRALASSNDNTEFALTGDLATEEQPMFIRFNGVGTCSGTVKLDFETSGFWYYLILDIKEFISNRKARVKFVDVPDLFFNFLQILEEDYSVRWVFPEFKDITTYATSLSQDGSIITASEQVQLGLVSQQSGGEQGAVFRSFSSWAGGDSFVLTLKPSSDFKGGKIQYNFTVNFNYHTTDSTPIQNIVPIIMRIYGVRGGSETTLGHIIDYSITREGETDKYTASAVGELTIDNSNILDSVGLNVFTNYPFIHTGQPITVSFNLGVVYKFRLDTFFKKGWSIGRPAWTEQNGMPKAITQYQQRIVFASTDKEPDVLWATETGEKYSFFKNVQIKSADAITTNIVDNKNAKIIKLSSLRTLLVFCLGSEFSLASEALTPASAIFGKQSEFGFMPEGSIEIVGNKVIFPQTMGTVLREFSYDYAGDSYSGKDLSIFVKHFFQGNKIVKTVFQQDPNNTLWVILDNGDLLSCTYMNEQELLAWAKHDIHGAVKDLCTIYGDKQNELYMIVKRTINGIDKYYIEKLAYNTNDIVTDCYLDSAKIAISQNKITTTRAHHLKNMEYVDVIADGVYMPDTPISTVDGTVDISDTLPDGANRIIIGIPFESKLRTLPINTDGQNVLLNRKIRFSNLDIFLHKSVTCEVGFKDNLKELIPPIYMEYNKCPVARSGWTRVALNANSEMGACCEIICDKPYPLTILGLITNAV